MCRKLFMVTESMSLHHAFLLFNRSIENFFIKVWLHSGTTVAVLFVEALRFLIVVFDQLILVLVESIVSWSLLKLWLLLDCARIDLIDVFNQNFFVSIIFKFFCQSILVCVLHEFSVVKTFSLLDLFSLILNSFSLLLVLFSLGYCVFVCLNIQIRFNKLRLR